MENFKSIVKSTARHPKYGTKKKEKRKNRLRRLPIHKYSHLRWGQRELSQYAKTVLQVWESIENVYAIGEKHKCYGYLIAELLGKSDAKNSVSVNGCTHLVSNHVICFFCEEIIDSIYRATKPCQVSNCNSRRRHNCLQKLTKCRECFVPTRGPITMNSFMTLLLCIKHGGFDFPLDLRKYVLYKICGSPR